MKFYLSLFLLFLLLFILGYSCIYSNYTNILENKVFANIVKDMFRFAINITINQRLSETLVNFSPHCITGQINFFMTVVRNV